MAQDNRTPGETRRVQVREVGPRDGFQNEPETIATADKIRLIDALGRAGLTRIEVASFVRPDVIPQLSDGIEVLKGIDLPEDVERMVLVPNSKGLDNALKVRDLFEDIALFVSASQTHNKRNINRTVEETMADVKVMGKRIATEGLKFCAVIATSFGCPFEGKVPMERVLDLAAEFAEAGATEIGFGDTTGMANPAYVREFFTAALERLPQVELTAHFHNTRGRGWPTPTPPWRPAAPASRRASVNWAAARSRSAPPATSPPRTWWACSTRWASTPALTWKSSSRRRGRPSPCSGAS